MSDGIGITICSGHREAAAQLLGATRRKATLYRFTQRTT